MCLHQKEGFQKALAMVGEEFQDRLEFYMSSWLPARTVVLAAVNERHKVQDNPLSSQYIDFCCE